MPIKIVGQTARVVDTDGLKIDELVGNVASKSDRISIALVSAKAGTCEPWLTLHYDEWICVTKGECVLKQEHVEDLSVKAGSTVLIDKGTRFQPTFPVDTEYVPVCLPAFRPDRCIREDETDENAAIATKLRKLHHDNGTGVSNAESPPEILYHMTTVKQWEAAKADGVYYPTTFEADGHYTHATGVPSRLVTTANHFYQDVLGDWVCVSFTRSALKKCGIFVRDEEAMPVGDKPVSADWGSWICPHIIGGIPTHIVDKEFRMLRDGPKFLSIEGLC